MRLRLIGTAFAVLAGVVSAHAACSDETPGYTVPQLHRAPVADGVIRSYEYRAAMTWSGEAGLCALTWDENFIYVAIRSETGRDGALKTGKGRHSICYDDSVELWFNPPDEARELGFAKFGQFQIMANSKGELEGRHHNPGFGLAAGELKLAGVKVGNSIHGDTWDFEIAIPAAVLGCTKFREADWGMLFARTFRTGRDAQKSFQPYFGGNGYADKKNHARHHLRVKGSATPQGKADGLFTGVRVPLPFNVTMRVVTSGPVTNGYRRFFTTSPLGKNGTLGLQEQRDYLQLFFHGRKSFPNNNLLLRDLPSRGDVTVFSVNVDEKGAAFYVDGTKKDEIEFPEPVKAEEFGEFQVTDIGYALRETRIRPGLRSAADIAADAQGDTGVAGTMKWYPSINAFAFDLRVAEGEFKKGLTLEVGGERYPLEAHFAEMRPRVSVVRLEGKNTAYAIHEVVRLKERLPDGKHVAVLKVGAETALTNAFLAGTRPWFNTQVGKADILLPGFTPVKKVRVQSSKFRVQSSEFKVQSSEFKVQSSEGGVRSSKFRVQSSEFKVQSSEFKVQSSEGGGKSSKFRVLSSEFRVQSSEDGVQSSKGEQGACDVIEVVGRKYVFAETGLPKEIWTLGQQILARPVALVDAKSVRVDVDAVAHRVNKEEKDPLLTRRASASTGGEASASTGGRGKDSASTGDSATTAYFSGSLASGRVEQDGLIRFTLRLPATDDAALEIPIKKEFAFLYHPVSECIRVNPAGFLPKGEGKIFGSRDIPQVHVSDFIPYCWIGTDDRGLCFAADSAKGWRGAPARDMVEIHREKDGTVVLRLNLVSASASAHEVELALMASPVKPQPAGWRGWADAYPYPCTRQMCCLMSGPCWGTYSSEMARVPTFEDFSIVRKLTETMETGECDWNFRSNWIQRVESCDIEKWARWIYLKKPEERGKWLRNHVSGGFHVMRQLHGKPDPTPYFYVCDCSSSVGLYDMDLMRDEWGPRVSEFGSFQDHSIYFQDKMLEAGMRGVYNDNSFFVANYDWVTGDAWIDEKGEVQPSFQLWANREFTRREVVSQVQRGITRPWVTIHHTNALTLPTMSFASNTMGMEWKYGTDDFQDRWTPDYVRAVNQGIQCGVYPTSLEGIFGWKTKEERIRLTRTMLAVLLPHEVQPVAWAAHGQTVIDTYAKLWEFGYHKGDCVYTAYWNPENPLVQREDVLVSVYRRGNRLLAVVGSYAREDVPLALRMKSGAVVSAKNFETGAPLAVADGAATLPLGRHDFALVELEVK